jgi:hypothetical protein
MPEQTINRLGVSGGCGIVPPSVYGSTTFDTSHPCGHECHDRYLLTMPFRRHGSSMEASALWQVVVTFDLW